MRQWQVGRGGWAVGIRSTACELVRVERLLVTWRAAKLKLSYRDATDEHASSMRHVGCCWKKRRATVMEAKNTTPRSSSFWRSFGPVTASIRDMQAHIAHIPSSHRAH